LAHSLLLFVRFLFSPSGRSYCINEEDGVVQDQFFRKIFEKGNDDETPPPLKTIGELRDAFSDKPFNFDRFDDRIDLLMGEWCAECFNEPRLAPFYFPDHPEQVPETDSTTGAANSPQNRIEVMNDLRTKRRNLRNTGEDPLQDSLRLAGLLSGQLTVAAAAAAAAASAAATTSRDPPDSRRASSLYRQKRSATQLQFDDDDDEEEIESDDPNGDGGTHQLSSLPVRGALNITEGEEGGDDTPRRSKKRKSQQKKYEGKRPWHEEEKTAIIEGIRRHGKGNWAEIKKDYDVLFAMRTSGQIKDCFRRMYDKGEIPKDLLLTVAADKGGDGGTPDKENTPA
jgi:Myb-like DNA-binding domain